MEGVSYYLGIDPGKSGGLAVVDHLGSMIRTYKMPETPGDLRDLFTEMIIGRPVGSVRATLENVNAGAWGHGKAGQKMGVTSAFSFGRGFGRLEMALAFARIPYDLVQPLTWQTALRCKSGGDKNITKARAQQLFPSVTVTHAIADALLIAEYCRRYWRVGAPRERAADGEEGTQNAGAEEKAVEGWQNRDARREVQRVESAIEFAQHASEEFDKAAPAGVGRHGTSPGRTDGRDPRAHRRRAR